MGSIANPLSCAHTENPVRAKLFHQQSEQHVSSMPDPYTVFLRWGPWEARRLMCPPGARPRHRAANSLVRRLCHNGRRLLQRQDWFTQEKAAKLLTVVIDSRPKKSSAYANGILAGDQAPSASAGAPDPAEPVRLVRDSPRSDA